MVALNISVPYGDIKFYVMESCDDSTGQWPGFSIQSPKGQKIYQAAVAAKNQREAEAAAAAPQAQDEHLAAVDVQQSGGQHLFPSSSRLHQHCDRSRAAPSRERYDPASKALRLRGQIGLEVKKLIVVGSGAIGALAVSALLGGGVASADDYAGQTYSDASSAASDAGQTVIVASRVGSTLSQDDCLVARSQPAPFTSAIDGSAVSSTVQFYLNCTGGYATATTPGLSQGSEEGRAAKAVVDEEEAKAQAQAAAAQNEQDQLANAGQTPGAPGE